MKIENYKVRGVTKYRFRAYIGIDPASGKAIRVKKSGYDTKREAQLAFAELVAKKNPVNATNNTFQSVYNIWLETYRLTVKDSTLRHTKQIFRDHILPEFGIMKLTDITPLMLQKFYNHQMEICSSPNKRFSKLAKIFDFALKQGMIDKNPALMVDRPRRRNVETKKRREVNFYTKDELNRFLSMAKEKLSLKWYVFFRVLAYTGMRRGEALALQWEDINAKDMTIRVSKTISQSQSGPYLSKTPKTEKSNRIILVDRETMELIQSLDRTSEFIFPNTKGSFCALSQPVRKIHAVVDGTDLKYISPHGFRHTHCSILFSAGVSIPEVQDRLGHTDVKTTIDVYNHVYQQDKKHALDRFIDYIDS